MRTAPEAASATRTVADLWSRAVETKASRAPSGLQIQSRTATSSPSIARWKSGGIWKRTTAPLSMSITTRCSIATASSPGSGYFQAFSTGCPALVSTRYISPTVRSSCWKVATFFESGDHSTIGLADALQPALSVA